MTAGAWVTYNHTPLIVGNATVDLDAAGTLRVVLIGSGYTPARTHTLWSDISANEVSASNGYAAGGYTLTQTYTRSGSTSTLDADDPTWAITTATVSAWTAVLMHKAGATLTANDLPLAYCILDIASAPHTVSPGNSLTLQLNVAGIFTIGD